MHSLGQIYSALVFLNKRPNSLGERFYETLIQPYFSGLMTYRKIVQETHLYGVRLPLLISLTLLRGF